MGIDVFDSLDFDRPLGPRSRDFDQVAPKDGFGELETSVLLSGGDDQGSAGAVGVVEHAQGVAEAGADVQVDDGWLSSGLSVPFGDRHHRDLL